MGGRNWGICHSCRQPGHLLYDCPTKKRCPVCGEGIEKCMEVEKNTKNIGRKFLCCTNDCGHFKWKDEDELSGESSCARKCSCNDKKPCQNLSCMFTTFAQITEKRDVEISVNITMRKGKGVTESNADEKGTVP